MTIIFVLIVALLVLAAVAVVIVPLVRTGSAQAVTQDDNSERFAVLSDSMRELDMEFEAGTLERGEYEEAKTELQRQAVDADDAPRQPAARTGRTVWAPTLVVAVVVPLLAVVLYVAMGQPAAVLAGATGAVVAQGADDPGADHVQAMIASLRQRLQEDSQDARGWTLLARAYAATGQSQQAMDAYAKAVALKPDSAGLLVEYANALGMFHDRNLGGKPQQLLKRALELQPDNLNALALAGAAAFQQGDRAAAVESWQRLKQLLPPDSAKQSRVDALIARAEGRQPAVAADTAIHGTITVSKALREKITAGDTLFIFARAPDGQPMPLAVVRQPAPQFPLQFTLDDTHAMVSGVHLSQYPVVNIVARVSRTGNATLQPGDLEGRVQSVSVGSENVRIVIDNRVGS